MTLVKVDASTTVVDVALRNSGYKTLEELEGKDFYRMDNLEEAACRIKRAIENKEIITVVGDYDVDGVTASGILYYVLTQLGANVRVRIPKRFSEGFGLNMNIIEEIDSGLIVTVDNGIVAFDPIARAKEKGLDVIITDHHEPDATGRLPEADIVIDPHIKGTADFTEYCGAGIAFRLIQHLTNDENIINKMSCFAALGTVADVMPLIEENRQIVKRGLRNMTTPGTRTSGLYSILCAAAMDKHITATDIAFKIGPMLNSPGRLFDEGAMISFESLVYDGPFDKSIGEKLNEHNENRKELVKQGVEAARKNISLNCLYSDVPLVIYEPSISEGIIGIIAGKLAEQEQIPVFVFTDSENPNIYKGSARTGGDVHLKNLLDDCKDTLYKYGGHAAAAGMSVEASNFEAMKDALQANCPEIKRDDDVDVIKYDLIINASDIPEIQKECDKLEPFGEGFPKPIFFIKNYQLSPRQSTLYKVMGQNGEHIKLFGIGTSAVGFDMTQDYHDLSDPVKLDFVGVLSENFYRDMSEVQIEIMYMEPSKASFAKSLLAQKLEEMAASRY